MRTLFALRDAPLVLGSVVVVLWVVTALAPLAGVPTVAAWERVLVALAVTTAFGWVSRALGATSIAGMLTGVFLGLLAVVLGGYGWFVVLVAFFAVGSLATKFKYELKADRGVAEPNDGARGTANVLGTRRPRSSRWCCMRRTHTCRSPTRRSCSRTPAALRRRWLTRCPRRSAGCSTPRGW